MALHQRKSERLKTEPSLAKELQEALPRSKSEASFSVASSARHQTVVTDPEILEEIRKRKAHRSQAARAVTVRDEGQRFSTKMPEDGWFFSASEEPFTERFFRSHEDQASLVARLASDWGVAAVSCKGCKGRGDDTVGQDNFLVAKLSNDWKVFCVFDGHGVDGHWPAWRLTETMPHFLDEEPCSGLLKTGDGAEALNRAFKSAQEDLEAYAAESGRDLHLCGSTATVALIPPSGEQLWVGTLGDSRAVLLHERVLEETNDHKASRGDEAARIKAAGGQVIVTEYEDGTEDARIAPRDMTSPQIAISRSFGDMIFKDSGVCAEPEVVCWQTRPDALLVICSDGVWEFLSSKDVCAILKDSVSSSGPEAASALLGLAKRAWRQNEAYYCDDITVVLAAVNGPLAVQNVKSKDACPGCENQSCYSQ